MTDTKTMNSRFNMLLASHEAHRIMSKIRDNENFDCAEFTGWCGPLSYAIRSIAANIGDDMEAYVTPNITIAKRYNDGRTWFSDDPNQRIQTMVAIAKTAWAS